MVTVFVLIDALGWKYVEGGNFLTDLLPNRKPLRTVLGFSSGAIPTILTGVPPAQNGHWNLFYYDPQTSPFRWLRYFQFLPDFLLDTRVSRKIIKELGRRVLGMGPLFDCSVSPRLLPLFNYVEKRNIYDPKGIVGASSIFDQFIARGVPYCSYTYHEASDAEILRQAEHDIRARKAEFFFLYLSEMDMFLHMHCNEPGEVEKRLRWYDEELRKIFAVAREVDSEATFAIASDHGMTPVQRTFDLVKEIESLGLRMPEDYLAVYDSTMGRFWFFNDRARQVILSRLQDLPCGRLLTDAELHQLGIFFADRRYGQVVFLLHPGWLISDSDFNGPSWRPVGMHGYHPDDSYSDGVFLTSEAPTMPVESIADVYLWMAEATHIAPSVERAS